MDYEIAFLLISVIIGIGFFSNYFFKKTRIPDVLWLIVFGAFLGPVFGIVDSSMLMPYFSFFSSIALLLILFEGGSQINIYDLIKESKDVFVLTTMGVLSSAVVVGIVSYFVLKTNIVISLLLGFIVGGTSSAIVVPILQDLEEIKKIKTRSSLVLKMESILTDPIVIIISLVLIKAAVFYSPGSISWQMIVTKVLSLLSISLVFGFFAGVLWGGIWHKFVKYKYHYMLTIGFLFLMYVVSEYFGGNGAIASFMIGLVLGNSTQVKKMLRLDHVITGLSKEIRTFNSYINFFVRTFFFTFVGVMITISRIDLILYGILISLILLGVRYLVVLLSTWKMNISHRDKIEMTLIYPRGLAAAVLASIPFVQYGIKETSIFPEIVFTVIITTVVISTLGTAFFQKKIEKEEKK